MCDVRYIYIYSETSRFMSIYVWKKKNLNFTPTFNKNPIYHLALT